MKGDTKLQTHHPNTHHHHNTHNHKINQQTKIIQPQQQQPPPSQPNSTVASGETTKNTHKTSAGSNNSSPAENTQNDSSPAAAAATTETGPPSHLFHNRKYDSIVTSAVADGHTFEPNIPSVKTATDVDIPASSSVHRTLIPGSNAEVQNQPSTCHVNLVSVSQPTPNNALHLRNSFNEAVLTFDPEPQNLIQNLPSAPTQQQQPWTTPEAGSQQQQPYPQPHYTSSSNASSPGSSPVPFLEMLSEKFNMKAKVIEFIRSKVSKNKKRYQFPQDNSGKTFDLSYIEDRIIAMGYPSSGIEGIYRNNIDDIEKNLNDVHGKKYCVYNLCAEKGKRDGYGKNRFNGNQKNYGFHDHCPPTFKMIINFCEDAYDWLMKDLENVIVVHCKAGKGRTGAMICCLLIYISYRVELDNEKERLIEAQQFAAGEYGDYNVPEMIDSITSKISQKSNGSRRPRNSGNTPIRDVLSQESALLYYGKRRTKDSKGVTIPSQKRSIRYVEVYFKYNLCYRPVRCQFLRLTLWNLPKIYKDNLWFDIYQWDNNDEKYRFVTSNKKEKIKWEIPRNNVYQKSGDNRTGNDRTGLGLKEKLGLGNAKLPLQVQPVLIYEPHMGSTICGMVKVDFYHPDAYSGKEPFFSAIFDTFFHSLPAKYQIEVNRITTPNNSESIAASPAPSTGKPHHHTTTTAQNQPPPPQQPNQRYSLGNRASPIGASKEDQEAEAANALVGQAAQSVVEIVKPVARKSTSSSPLKPAELFESNSNNIMSHHPNALFKPPSTSPTTTTTTTTTDHPEHRAKRQISFDEKEQQQPNSIISSNPVLPQVNSSTTNTTSQHNHLRHSSGSPFTGETRANQFCHIMSVKARNNNNNSNPTTTVDQKSNNNRERSPSSPVQQPQTTTTTTTTTLPPRTTGSFNNDRTAFSQPPPQPLENDETNTEGEPHLEPTTFEPTTITTSSSFESTHKSSNQTQNKINFNNNQQSTTTTAGTHTPTLPTTTTQQQHKNALLMQLSPEVHSSNSTITTAVTSVTTTTTLVSSSDDKKERAESYAMLNTIHTSDEDCEDEQQQPKNHSHLPESFDSDDLNSTSDDDDDYYHQHVQQSRYNVISSTGRSFSFARDGLDGFSKCQSFENKFSQDFVVCLYCQDPMDVIQSKDTINEDRRMRKIERAHKRKLREQRRKLKLEQEQQQEQIEEEEEPNAIQPSLEMTTTTTTHGGNSQDIEKYSDESTNSEMVN